MFPPGVLVFLITHTNFQLTPFSKHLEKALTALGGWWYPSTSKETGDNFALCLPPPGRGLLSMGAGPVVGQCRRGPAFLAACGSQQAAAVLGNIPGISEDPKIIPQWFASLYMIVFQARSFLGKENPARDTLSSGQPEKWPHFDWPLVTSAKGMPLGQYPCSMGHTMVLLHKPEGM